jgi:hypothetical protein
MRSGGHSLVLVAALVLVLANAAQSGSLTRQAGLPSVRGRKASDALRSVRGGIAPAPPAAAVAVKPSEVAHGAAEHHGMSIFTLAINIMADLCPHGMLPLAYGMSCEGSTGLVPALSLLLTFGLLSGYTLFSIARSAEVQQTKQQLCFESHNETVFPTLVQVTRKFSFRGIWSRSLDPKSAWVIDAGYGTCGGC